MQRVQLLALGRERSTMMTDFLHGERESEVAFAWTNT